MTEELGRTEPDSDLEGRYRLGALAHSTGLLDVYEATDVRLGRPVVVKFLAAALADDPSARERFEEASRDAASVTEYGTPVYDSGSADGRPYVVAEKSTAHSPAREEGDASYAESATGIPTASQFTAAILGAAPEEASAPTTVQAAPSHPTGTKAADPSSVAPDLVRAGDTQQLDPVELSGLGPRALEEPAIDAPPAQVSRPARQRPTWLKWPPAWSLRRVWLPVAVVGATILLVALALIEQDDADPMQPPDSPEVTAEDRADLPPEIQNP